MDALSIEKSLLRVGRKQIVTMKCTEDGCTNSITATKTAMLKNERRNNGLKCLDHSFFRKHVGKKEIRSKTPRRWDNISVYCPYCDAWRIVREYRGNPEPPFDQVCMYHAFMLRRARIFGVEYRSHEQYMLAERLRILEVLSRNDWYIGGCAKFFGVAPNTLRARIREHNLQRDIIFST